MILEARMAALVLVTVGLVTAGCTTKIPAAQRRDRLCNQLLPVRLARLLRACKQTLVQPAIRRSLSMVGEFATS